MDKDINHECRQIWNDLGAWWDQSVNEGDYFHQAFLYPTIEKLLDLKGGESILDAGCGNGALSKRLEKMGGKVFGIDVSSSLLNRARERHPHIPFEEADLTNKNDLLALTKSGKFDRIVSNMVLHDIPTVIPFFESLKQLLNPQGSFIFTIPHPCFNSAYTTFEPNGSILINGYIRPKTNRMKSKQGQPIEQICFERPLRDYFNLLISQNMVMNGFEEPCVDPRILPEGSIWKERPDIPPAIISRWSFL